MSKIRVVLLSAGLKPSNFELASRRISLDAGSLYEFAEIIVLNSQNISEYCPKVFEAYQDLLNERVKGYGYWLWKPEFILGAMKGRFGNFDQVVWVDSGCEINSNYLSRSRFRRRIVRTQSQGYWLHALKSSDNEYSKSKVKNLFPELSLNAMHSPQIQANYLHFSSQAALQLVQEWHDLSIASISNFNFEISENEHINFVEHRNDQSVLSLLAKKYNFEHSRLDLPTGKTRRSVVRGVTEPVWISRNRSGASIVPTWVRRIP